MGYAVDAPDGIVVLVGVDSNDNPGVVFPTGGGPVIALPSDPKGRYDYLPRHELFHAFQYHYIAVGDAIHEASTLNPKVFYDDLMGALGSVNWWMEATAEWAAHESYLNDPDAMSDHPDQYPLHAHAISDFLGVPGQALNAWGGLSTGPQYGAFPLAQFLTDCLGDRQAVLHTWQKMKNQLPLEAITQVITDNGLDPAGTLSVFALYNYTLRGGYTDPDVDTVWRDWLASEPSTARDALGDPRPARSNELLGWDTPKTGQVKLWPGGSVYIDLQPPWDVTDGTGRTGRLNVKVTAAAELRYRLVEWKYDPTTRLSYPAISAEAGPVASGELSLPFTSASRFATLMVTRTDLVPDSEKAVKDIKTATWSASFTTTGTVRAWGSNETGQLGNGTTTDSGAPVQVKGLTDVTAVASSGGTTYAVRANGTVWAWGDNSYGQLGDGTTALQRTKPVTVTGLTTVIRIAAGTNSAYALHRDGRVSSWGGNWYGELGTGTTATTSNHPTVIPGLSRVAVLAGGTYAGYAGYAGYAVLT